MNDFFPTMTLKVFSTLRDHHQIPDGKFEKYYSGKTENVGMYDAMFTAGLKLPLTKLHHQLAD